MFEPYIFVFFRDEAFIETSRDGLVMIPSGANKKMIYNYAFKMLHRIKEIRKQYLK